MIRSGSWRIGTQSESPALQQRESGPSTPRAQRSERSAKLTGPTCWPSMATYHSTAAGSDSSSLRKTFSKAWPSSSSSATSIPVGAWTWPQWGQTTSPPEVGSGRGCWQRSQRASIDALENPSAAGVEGSGRRRYLSQASSKGSRNHLKREEAQRLRHADADAVGAAREDGDLGTDDVTTGGRLRNGLLATIAASIHRRSRKSQRRRRGRFRQAPLP